jgi:hypothetical protein
MRERRGKAALPLTLLALVVLAPGAFAARALEDSARAVPVRADAGTDDAQRAASETVGRAEAALRDQSVERLAEAFSGAPPAWARDRVEACGKGNLFERQWKGRAVRLPRPYRGAEWLGVFSMYHPVEGDADHFHRLSQRDGTWTLGLEIDEQEPAAEYAIRHHNLQVRLDPAGSRVEAVDRMTVDRLAGASGLLLARMNDDYEVSDVRVARVPVAFARAGGLLAVSLPTGPPGELTVEARYSGVVHHPGMDDIAPEGAYLFSYWYPNVARLPTTLNLTVTAPSGWTVIGQGEREDRTEEGAEARTRWRLTHPVCWLQFAAGPYERTSRAVGGTTLNVYLRRPNPEKAQAALSTLAKALPFYSRSFGAYPWTHYDVVEFPLAVGALESYSFTGMSQRLIPRALSHELAHTWWGGLVPNTYMVDMWNEAFATYSERLLRETEARSPQSRHRFGEDRPRGRRYPAGVPILGAVNALRRSHAAVGYGKGAAVLHMFRRTVGDGPFRRALARFVRERSGQASTWRDFQRSAEAELGRKLDGFFDPWLTRGDAPRLRWVSARQENGTLDAEVELLDLEYRLRLSVAIDTNDGKRHTTELEVVGARTRFRRPIAAPAVRLVLDPEADFLLAPADAGPHPWTLELKQTTGIRLQRPVLAAGRMAGAGSAAHRCSITRRGFGRRAALLRCGSLGSRST